MFTGSCGARPTGTWSRCPRHCSLPRSRAAPARTRGIDLACLGLLAGDHLGRLFCLGHAKLEPKRFFRNLAELDAGTTAFDLFLGLIGIELAVFVDQVGRIGGDQHVRHIDGLEPLTDGLQADAVDHLGRLDEALLAVERCEAHDEEIAPETGAAFLGGNEAFEDMIASIGQTLAQHALAATDKAVERRQVHQVDAGPGLFPVVQDHTVAVQGFDFLGVDIGQFLCQATVDLFDRLAFVLTEEFRKKRFSSHLRFRHPARAAAFLPASPRQRRARAG